jgi:hypothetical protein
VSAVIERARFSAAHTDQGQTILLDAGDQAIRWQYGNYFATSVGTSRLVEGTYIPWAAFNFSMLPMFHQWDRLIVVAPMELNATEGHIRVYQGRRMDTFLGSRRKSFALDRELLEVLAILHLCNRLPERRALVAVRSRSIQPRSDGRSPLLDADRWLAVEVERLVLGWQSNRSGWRRA